LKKRRKEMKIKYNKEYRKKNRLKMNKYDNQYKKRRKEEDPEYRMGRILRHYFRQTLLTYTKTGKIMPSNSYGINFKAITRHLKPLPKDFSKYHVHHIRPLHTFNFINKDGSTNLKEVKKAWEPKNLKLLTIEEHRRINHWKL
ncbi:hypothetical protein LCGC14_2842350, partial [marine sediment metagenome]